ncbi:hypothetical protein PDESU_01899 [Pontiella desulfatans]|uniref:DUF1593 domain-containing protein n=1 Tax=Pontiella desulfatans TaxID=2750659 RepID=A0A6C2U0E6_PONDE|nr:nucleoside hydrolase-like domain-containing protein [Pontiella desulfatans]VGO13343.1 hypothetical protein PDESU_01899 [Pontiella desulfatans]
MRSLFLILAIAVAASSIAYAEERINARKHRLIILADMGNEPDEEQQMMHMLMYNNEFDLEGLIAVSGKFLRPEAKQEYRRNLHPELFLRLIDGYEKVLPNLKLHADGWHEPDGLRRIVATGQKGYGIGDIGKGRASPGSRLITTSVLKDDPRPIYVVVNAGANTLAQALLDYRASHTPEETEAFVNKLMVYENGSQDDAGAWINHEFPSIHWIRSNWQTYGYMGDYRRTIGPYVWKPYPFSAEGQHQWAKENIQTGHGALGELYPDRFHGKGTLEGGGTTPWLGLITRGLHDPWHPHWGGWSGRYTKEKQKNILSRHKDIAPTDQKHTPFHVFADAVDTWTFDGETFNDDLTPIHRWRQHILGDFKGRMDWCVEPFGKANHNPVAVVDGNSSRTIRVVHARPGETLSFDASASSDPDNGQTLSFKWWIYPEAGTCTKTPALEGADRPHCKLMVPADAGGSEIHLILDVADNCPIAVMRDYRRFVVRVAD